MTLGIKGVCENYFNGVKELSNFRTNDVKTNLLASAKVLSIFTVVIPAAFAVVYGISSLAGRIYSKLYLTPIDNMTKKVFKRCLAAAIEGNVTAQYTVAWSYQHGRGVTKNREKAFHWYNRAAEQGDAKAQYKVGVCYQRKIGNIGQSFIAFEYFKKSADQGYAKALREVGECYNKGRGVTKDVNAGFKCLKLSADKGDIKALNLLGIAHVKGEGTPEDYKAAMAMYEKSAELGVRVSADNIADMYSLSNDADKDQLEAKWRKKASDLGWVNAQWKLGNLYIEGRGVAKDVNEGYRLIKQAAFKGNIYAQNRFGELLEQGIGTKINVETAKTWYEGVKDKVPAAQANLDRLNPTYRKQFWQKLGY